MAVELEGAEPEGEPNTPPVDAHSDLLRFLDQLTAADPKLADAALSTEIDDLLGYDTKRPETKSDRFSPLVFEAQDADGISDFDWYSQILPRLPSLDESYTYEAARQVEVGLLAAGRLADMNRGPTSRRELSELYTLSEEGQAAWEWLVLSNLRLVFHWSKGVARSVDPDWAQDAFQVAAIGLIRGLERWDYTLGYKLSTFVSWHIRQAIQRWRANDVMIIRVPVHVWDSLSGEDRLTSDAVREAAERAQDLASIEAMLDRGEDAPWDGGFEALESRIDLDRTIDGLLDELDERSLDIIERRFGLRDDLDGPMTLDEIGEVWGVTRERIRQLEKKIMDALREKAAGRESPPIIQYVKRHPKQSVRPWSV